MKTKDDEFEQFDKVMGGLLAVPYSELQEKLKDEKRDKEKKKRAKTSSSGHASTSGKKRDG